MQNLTNSESCLILRLLKRSILILSKMAMFEQLNNQLQVGSEISLTSHYKLLNINFLGYVSLNPQKGCSRVALWNILWLKCHKIRLSELFRPYLKSSLPRLSVRHNKRDRQVGQAWRSEEGGCNSSPFYPLQTLFPCIVGAVFTHTSYQIH